MSTLTFESTRFGTVEIAADAVIEFPAGLIGLGGTRYALVSADPEGAFHWLHSRRGRLAGAPRHEPVAVLRRLRRRPLRRRHRPRGGESPDVWVTVRTGSEPGDFSANLRAPILVAEGRGHQVINEATDAPVRAALFAGDGGRAGGLAARTPDAGHRSQRTFQGGTTVLIITRRAGERIMVGDDVVVEIMEIVGNSVRVGISAPRSVPVYREEIYTAVRDENRAAAESGPVELPSPEAR